MGLIARSLGIRNFSLEDPSQPLMPLDALAESLGWARSDAGVVVNEKAALRITTALTCIRIISEDLATCSHDIMQTLPDGSMLQAKNHRMWSIIHDKPNPDLNMPASIFWGALVASAVGWGNGYAWIKRDRAARVIGLSMLDPARTTPTQGKSGTLVYETTQTTNGQVEEIEPENVLHLRGISFDGIKGLSPVQLCKNAYGLAIGAEKFGALLFGQGARASGVLKHPNVLGPEAQENLKKSLRERISGDNALMPLILEEGMEWQQISINPDDAQFLAVRQFQKEEIACIYRVPMHLLQSLLRATNNNIEHQGLDYVRHCLKPWAVRLEEEVNLKLLGAPFTMEHNLNDMQRGDFAAQTSGIQTLRNIGLYSTNDGLRKLRENPISAEDGGDVRVVQGAFINLTALLNPEPTDGSVAAPSGDTGGESFNRITLAYRTMVRDAVGRAITHNKDQEFIVRIFRPIISSMAQAMLAVRLGACDLNQEDLDYVNQVAHRIAATADIWKSAKTATNEVTAEMEELLDLRFGHLRAAIPSLPVQSNGHQLAR